MAMDNQRPRILLLIPHLGGGGAERVIELLACGLNKERFEVHLCVVCRTRENVISLPAHIHTHYLGARRVRASWWRVLRLVLQVKPQLVLSGMAHLNFLVLLLRVFYPRGAKALVRQNGALPASRFSLISMGYFLIYPWADGIIAQSEAMADEISERLRIDAVKVRTLNNPIVFPVERSLNRSCGDKFQLLAVGRLVPEKGFDLLLRACAKLRPKYPALRVTIAGEGNERVPLEQMIESLGLHCYAKLTGYVEVPFEAMNSDLFVLSSRSEGMPNALLEAAAYGLPIVGTPCSKSVTSLLTGKPGVWLAEDVSVEALEAAFDAAVTAFQPGTRFAHEFIAPFECQRAITAYEAYFDDMLAR